MSDARDNRTTVLAFAAILGNVECSRDRGRLIDLGAEAAASAGVDPNEFIDCADADQQLRRLHPLDNYDPRTIAERIIEGLEGGTMKSEDITAYVEDEAKDLVAAFRSEIIAALEGIRADAAESHSIVTERLLAWEKDA